MKTLLKNAYLVDENHDFQVLDVLVEDNKIAAVGEITQSADRVIDMTGWTLLPGFIDAKIPVVELKQLRQAGLPFVDVIKTGTSDAARIIGTFNEEGTIEAGKLANLVAVKSRLDDSFEALNNVDFVMHYGEIIKG